MNKWEVIRKLESVKAIGNDVIATCYNESVNSDIMLVKEIDKPQKPAIPQPVAGWFEESTNLSTKAEKIACLIKSEDGDSYYFCDWFVRDDIATQEQGGELLTWVIGQSYGTLLSLHSGYGIEKGPLWVIRNADGSYPTKCVLWGKDGVDHSFEYSPSHRLLFTGKAIADAAALLVNGIAEEVIER